MAAWGPIEFSATEVAVILAFVGLVPPFVIAFLGSFVHSFVVARRDPEVTLLQLFLKWWMWWTAGWLGACLLALLFA